MPSVQELRDAAIAADVREVLEDHPALRTAAVDIAVCGGVVHVCGNARSTEERALLRRVIARVRGVNAVWDRLTVDEPLRVLDLGCGTHKQIADAVGVDRHPLPAVDVLAHLDRGLPFADDCADHVYAIHFLEHVTDLLRLMNEVHRVLKPDGVLHVMAPHWRCINAVADPTHCRLFDRQTFKFFCRPYPGQRLYRPLAIGESRDDLFADLQPLKDGSARNSEERLARFFD